MSDNPLLTTNDLSVTYSRWGQTIKALDMVTTSVAKGEWVVLVGPNGSGKSTFLKVVSGQVIADSGVARIDGREVRDMTFRELADYVFLVQQDPLLGTAPILTVFENLMVVDHDGKMSHGSKHALSRKYLDLLTPLGLGNRMKQPVKTLSGGERQLLALLIARLRPSPLVLLDEPLSSLDPQKAELCMNEVSTLNSMGKTVIQVTHDAESAVSIGTRTLVFGSGRLIYDSNGKQRSLEAIRQFWYT